jgi:hypothetical protein
VQLTRNRKSCLSATLPNGRRTERLILKVGEIKACEGNKLNSFRFLVPYYTKDKKAGGEINKEVRKSGRESKEKPMNE